jgi:hypothetical protein
MPQTVPTQHPAVVLRSHYRQLRALLAVAMIGVVCLSAVVVILANDDAADTRSATPASAPTEPADGPRYIHPPGKRYDPGPRGMVPTQPRESAPSPQRKLDEATDTRASGRSSEDGIRNPPLVPPSRPERHQKPGLNGPGMRR